MVATPAGVVTLLRTLLWLPLFMNRLSPRFINKAQRPNRYKVMRKPLTRYKQIKDKQEKLRSIDFATTDVDENKGTKAPQKRPQGGNDAMKRHHHRDHNKVLGFHPEP
jgi:hypothetical protein